MRQIILDTETTGLKPQDGHRIIEIGCVELVDRKLTGNHFHEYINPDREVDPGALAVHGISNEFLSDKPRFNEVVKAFIDFVSGAELVIHNAPFDVGFLNHELKLLRGGYHAITHYCTVTDTLKLARQLHIGQRNSLDALCKRYGVDNTNRELHGALLDADLLAQVYLAMTGGQGSFFDALTERVDSKSTALASNKTEAVQYDKLTVIKADEDELKSHKNYLQMLLERGKCVWSSD